MQEEQAEGLLPPQYIHIEQNDFLYRKHKKQKEEDIATCLCKYNADDPDTACGERCLNVLTSTECTPEYCPCGTYCKNQKFQKCEYAKLKLVKTEGRGWGLLADENIKEGQFIIEYCGEVISRKEARRRSHTYELQGLKDAFIITLNAYESIDATRKGSLARFINHSCQPNCETRKWTVLGEVRVGIFSKQDIPVGAELAYDYNFEWFGGAKVRCLCSAASCSGFLGAKSRGFQEDTYLWEDDDDRYSVENIPLYDSEEDGPKILKASGDSSKVESSTMIIKHDHSLKTNAIAEPVLSSQSSALVIEPLDSIPMEGVVMNEGKIEVSGEMKVYQSDTNATRAHQAFAQKNAMVSRIRSNSACRNYYIQWSPMSNKKSANYANGKSKHLAQKQVDAAFVAQLLASKEARDEINDCEEKKKEVTYELDMLYNEIRPAIEEHEKDSQESVSTSLAEKWIEASCAKLKAEFDLYASIIKNVTSAQEKAGEKTHLAERVGDENGMKYLTNY